MLPPSLLVAFGRANPNLHRSTAGAWALASGIAHESALDQFASAGPRGIAAESGQLAYLGIGQAALAAGENGIINSLPRDA
jgi:hypothetical protein